MLGNPVTVNLKTLNTFVKRAEQDLFGSKHSFQKCGHNLLSSQIKCMTAYYHPGPDVCLREVL